jgi:hypothetical protein
MVDANAEGAAHYCLMIGRVNWTITLGHHDVQHIVSALSCQHWSNDEGRNVGATTSITIMIAAPPIGQASSFEGCWGWPRIRRQTGRPRHCLLGYFKEFKYILLDAECAIPFHEPPLWLLISWVNGARFLKLTKSQADRKLLATSDDHATRKKGLMNFVTSGQVLPPASTFWVGKIWSKCWRVVCCYSYCATRDQLESLLLQLG